MAIRFHTVSIGHTHTYSVGADDEGAQWVHINNHQTDRNSVLVSVNELKEVIAESELTAQEESRYE